MSKLITLEGRKVNRLTVVSKAYQDKYKHWYWNCKCECGNDTIVAGCDLRSGKAISCGCYKRGRASELNKTHGMKKTRLYNVWARMKQRCINPKAPEYDNYGGRGIRVCCEWLDAPESFFDWAERTGYNSMAKRGECTLERLDVDGDYEPSNCKWATAVEQNNNRRNNRKLEYNGETHTIAQWSRKLGIKKETLCARLRYGWSVEKALTTKVRNKKG